VKDCFKNVDKKNVRGSLAFVGACIQRREYVGLWSAAMENHVCGRGNTATPCGECFFFSVIASFRSVRSKNG